MHCYKRRLKATQDIASVCPRLQLCDWYQIEKVEDDEFHLLHEFIVEEQMPVTGLGLGDNVTRVVRGVKQHWMGRDYDTENGIVKCKLEDLPGNIIGQNDSDVE